MRELNSFEVGLLLGRLGLTAAQVEDILDGTLRVQVVAVQDEVFAVKEVVTDIKAEPVPNFEDRTAPNHAILEVPKVDTVEKRIEQDLDDIFGTTEKFEEPDTVIEPAPDKWALPTNKGSENIVPVVTESATAIVIPTVDQVSATPETVPPISDKPASTTSNPWLSNKWETLK